MGVYICTRDLATANGITQANHNPHKVAEQLMHGGTYDETSTYFNKNWSNQEIEDAVNFAYNYAVNMGFTDGTSSVMYNGELITVYIGNGQFKTAYGNYVYSYAELLGLIGGN